MTIALALVLSLLTTQRDSSPAVRELEQLEEQLASAWKRGDCDAWGALIAPEWSVTHITGAVMTRNDALRMCKAPEVPLLELTSDEIVVRLFGDAAVVTGRTTVAVGGATPATVRLRFTDVFIRRTGRWQVVASHATRLEP